MQAVTATAQHLKLAVPQFTVRGADDLAGAFAAMVKQRAGALLVPNNPLLNLHAKTVAGLALKHRLLSSGNAGFPEAGGTLGYGVNFSSMYHRATVHIDKILKGAKPGDIPIERPIRFEFTVNLKTAKALGIKLPGTIVIRATKVIE